MAGVGLVSAFSHDQTFRTNLLSSELPAYLSVALVISQQATNLVPYQLALWHSKSLYFK